LFLAKTGEEIVNEQTYSFEDRGQRKVVIRPEMTPSVSRMVAARRQELPYPLRWYSIPNLWRYERPQKGRLREHWQLNVDIFGVEGLRAEMEIIEIASQILIKFGATSEMFTIKLNSRLLMDYVLKECLSIDGGKLKQVSHLVDRKAKMEADDFEGAIKEVLDDSNGEITSRLIEVLKARTLNELPEAAKASANYQEVDQLLGMLKQAGVNNVTFDPTVFRGFDYYTDIVFEIYDTHPENNRSMFGGGRYDGLIALFGVEPVPTVGFGMGDVTLQNFLELHQLLPALKPETEVLVIMVDDVADHAQTVLNQLREKGIRVTIDWMDRKIDNSIRAAVKKRIPYVLFIGNREVSDQVYSLKELASGQEQKLNIDQIAELISKQRGQ
jgi:histidyl-tRNA synthetase